MKTVKKFLAKAIAVTLLAALVCSAVLCGNAATIYNSNGFSYTLITADRISVCGWDNRTPDFIVPDKLAERYVTEIADYALMNNTLVQSVDITNAGHLGRIGVMAFAGCSGLGGEIVIPNSVSSVDLGAFQGCSSITDVIYYANLKTISAQSFYKCSSLKTVELPMFLEKIEKLAFAGCTSLETIYIPPTVNSISTSAFKNDEKLVIFCESDSYAHKFAAENGIPFVLSDNMIVGDVDLDGYVNIIDATAILKHIVDIEPLSGESLALADVDKDGDVTVIDSTTIQKIIAEII